VTVPGRQRTTDPKTTVVADIRLHGLPDDLGYEIAEALDLEAMCDLGSGSEGTAFALADGSVLKVTVSANEAALAFLLMEGELEGHGLFPRIVDVRRVPHVDQDVFAIVREEISGLKDGEPDERVIAIHEDWLTAKGTVVRGLPMTRAATDAILAGPVPRLLEFVERAGRLKAAGQLAPEDVNLDSVGFGTDGSVVFRDFGRFGLRDAAQAGRALDRIPAVDLYPPYAR
jgi:hypothetical protein